MPGVTPGAPEDPLLVLAPPDLADRLPGSDPRWQVTEWDGRPPLPERGAVTSVWVPPYSVAARPELVRDTLAQLPQLRVVQLLSAGVEPWPGLVPPQVTLCSGRGIHGGSTAELAVALLLAVVRQIPAYVEQQQRHEWRRHQPDTLSGRNVLVLGAGDIGQRVGAVLSALGAHVSLVGRTARAGVLTTSDVPRLLGSADVLVVALPHTRETDRLVDGDMLAALPDGAVVVNIARGAIVDQDALAAEVVAGRLRAGLDVTDPEPLPPEHPLWTAPGALVTPHVGGGATGWPERARQLVEAQLQRLLDGRPLANVVTAGY